MNTIISFLSIAYLWLLFCPTLPAAQSLTGTTGLLTIPTAEIAGDGEVKFGANLVNKKYNILYPDAYHQYSYFMIVGFMPFMEVSLRLTRPYDFPNPDMWGIGDRMPSVRLQFLRENHYCPSMVLGVHDFMWAFGGTQAINYNALYVVATKHDLLDVKRFSLSTALHLGYGTDVIKAAHHQFAGVFGGFSLSYRKTIALMVEYDTEKFNGGIEFDGFNHVQFLLALLNFDSFSFGASIHLVIPKKVR